ncbi:SDR family oxidoreductase [Algoriphagus sediminis]|uniref:SDR family oxidoreductase n=1 Tax=Algoriphagus sediminis TaxID=3057113 RepID=A0ABT7Y7M9_9BACT|nr:SDR family oxidoreductase [Algoriphagus sediminis]MDN3202516.1 SDR family oxidoreductase [Algoriphagus sediminis]
MDLGLKDKVIIITGGSQGIGAATTDLVIEEGGIPVVIDPNVREGENLENKPGMFIQRKLVKPKDSEASVSEIIRRFGRIDAIINNAGINDQVGLMEGSPELFRASLEKNLTHCYDLIHFALPHLKKTKGSIVNISSKTAVTGQGSTSGYTASKGGLLALTREWAVELLPFSIRVNAVIPAEVDTPLYQQWLASFENPDEKLKEVSSKIPLEKRLTKPEEIASTVLFLISKRASHITGQHLFVDGGYTHLDRSL